MAQGLVKITNPHIIACVDEVKVAYLKMRRTMDAMIVMRNGTDYEAVAVAADASGDALTPAEAGQRVFDNLDAAMAGMTTAYNALSNMDKNAL